ncbi:hypothetical protein JB92DRAFT_2730094 [Gautieria morchelliformis]|nr:hypothetical protein JB92DRAFT_2730094 [Gautieria morchelliformis]
MDAANHSRRRWRPLPPLPIIGIHNQPTSKLCSLPEEILICILSLVHPATLVACGAVCRMLRDMIAQSVVLNYHIELYADGMVDGDNCQLPVAERLSQLRMRRQTWREVKWEHRLFPLVPGSWNAYELVDGIFSKTLNSTGNAARGIMFASLPSRDNPGSLILFEDVGITFRDFAMDPTQDLIVYMQCGHLSDASGYVTLLTHVTLHFRTISDNKTHPQARLPTMSVMFPSDVIGAVIQIVNEIVGFMTWDNLHSQLYIWDWEQCMELVVRYSSQTNLAALDDFAFVSDRAYVLASPVPAACFRVYTFGINPDGNESPAEPCLHAILRLPAMREGAAVSLLGIHTGPFTTNSSQRLRPPKAFVTAPHARIHVVSIDLARGSNPPEPPASCLIVIRNKTFLAYAEHLEPVDVPWDDWGPAHTRWIPGTTGSLWLRYVHGERFIRLYTPADDGPRYIEMYDFGAPYVPPSWVTREENILMHQAHELLLDDVFESPVIYRLPCRILAKQENLPYSGFMLDEDRLVGLKVRDCNITIAGLSNMFISDTGMTMQRALMCSCCDHL